MRLVTEFGVYPHATITGRGLPAVDTGVDVHWPGPGRVYLHPQDVADAVAECHQHEDVAGRLEALGWVPASVHGATVEALAGQLREALGRAEQAEEQLDAVLATVRLLDAVAVPDVAEDGKTIADVATMWTAPDVKAFEPKPEPPPVKRGPGRPRKHPLPQES